MSIFDMFGGGNKAPELDMDQVREMIRLQSDINRPNTNTPFGSVSWTDNNAPLSFEEWSQGRTTPGNWDQRRITDQNDWWSDQQWQNAGYSRGGAPTQEDYQKYVSGINPDPQMDVSFSPEIQGLFDRQFDPNAYDQYKDDYMQEFQYRTDPVFERQDDRFAQGMFDRGQPEGGELYNEQYLLKEQAQNDALASAIRQAGLISDNARIQDYNRLMGAFGGTQVQANPIDVMGPYNMAQNVAMQNQQNQRSIWDFAPMLAGSYMMGMPEGSAMSKLMYGG